jgi:hypothetical protein
VAVGVVEATSRRVPAEEGTPRTDAVVVVRALGVALEAPPPKSNTTAPAAIAPAKPASSVGRNSRLMGHLRFVGMRR